MLGGAHVADRTDERVRVLVVEENRLFGEGLRLLLEQDDRVRVVGIATTVDEATACMRDVGPDVALIGSCLAHPAALEAIGDTRGEASLVVLGNTQDDELLGRALEAGALAVIDDVAGPSDLVRAIERVRDGECLLSPSVIRDVIRRRAMRRRAATERNGHASDLTPRERQVLDLLAEGCDSKGIAKRLGLSADTVRGYVQNVLEKLEAHSRIEAVIHADRLGLVRLRA